ncbi:MFS general substrate transporter [Hypoxylon argillaceum]|nr:MFS general substrate transporter [Hypoxylon argillaceum]
MFSSFMLALDNTILGTSASIYQNEHAKLTYALATAIPQITHDFESLDDIGCCGRLYTFYSIKWTYVIMLPIFELGSIVCALAPNSTTLIVGRAVTGLGAAGLLSGATFIISYCAALEKRAFLLALIFGVYGVGSVTGPLIGGVITDNKTLSWRFIFWVNLHLSQIQRIRQIEIIGAILLISVFGTIIGFALILITFILLQLRDKVNCTIPLRIFRNRTVCAACAFILSIQVATVTQTYYWPIYFQSVKNTNAQTSGIFVLPLVISNTLTTVIAGWVTSKLRHYVPFTWIGPPILAVGGGLFQLIHLDSPPSAWIGYQVISGLGYGLCNQMPIIAVQTVLDKVDVPTGCVMVIFFQGLGGILATIDIAAVIKAGANGFRAVVPTDLLATDVFLVTLATPLIALAISTAFEWRRLPRGGKM